MHGNRQPRRMHSFDPCPCITNSRNPNWISLSVDEQTDILSCAMWETGTVLEHTLEITLRNNAGSFEPISSSLLIHSFTHSLTGDKNF